MNAVRTSRELGAAIRERRRGLKWAQAELAGKIGVNRRWVIDVERGKDGAEVGLVLRALGALGMKLLVDAGDPTEALARTRRSGHLVGIATDVDSIIQRARKP